MSKEKAKAFAKKHGYKLRQMPHNASNPNGYVKVIAPDEREYKAADWIQAREIMMGNVYGKRK